MREGNPPRGTPSVHQYESQGRTLRRCSDRVKELEGAIRRHHREAGAIVRGESSYEGDEADEYTQNDWDLWAVVGLNAGESSPDE